MALIRANTSGSGGGSGFDYDTLTADYVLNTGLQSTSTLPLSDGQYLMFAKSRSGSSYNLQVGDVIKDNEEASGDIAVLNIKNGSMSGWGSSGVGGNLSYSGGTLSWYNNSGSQYRSAYICKLTQ